MIKKDISDFEKAVLEIKRKIDKEPNIFDDIRLSHLITITSCYYDLTTEQTEKLWDFFHETLSR